MAPFGEWLRRYRIEHRFTLREMARRVGVSAAYLSAVEVGQKGPSEKLLVEIVTKFGLKEEDAQELRRAADQSARTVRVQLAENRPRGDAEIAALFARNFGELDDEKKARIRKILED